MSLRSAYSTIFQPVLQDGTPFQGQINAAIPGNVAIGDSTTAYTLSINNQTITSTSGSLNISGNVTATGSLTVSAATISNALNVSGITTVSALNVQNYLNVSGLSSLSNVNICGAVNITGNTFFNSNVEVKRSLSAESVYSKTLSGVVNINGAPYIAGGNPFNWSTLPAISDVDMSGYSILGISNLIVSNNVVVGGSTNINSSLSAESVYATTLSGITLINGAPYIPGVNPASWSTYPAVTNLSMGGFNLGDVNAVSISGRLIVDGSATINGLTRLSNANISGLLSVSGGNVQNKWNVSGQLNAENASIIANLGVSGDTVVSNAYVTSLYGGATTLSSLAVQSNVSISGETLLVGKVTVSDVLNVSGLTTVSGLTVQNNVSVGGIVYATNLSAVSFINGISFNAAGIPSNWASYGAVGDVNLSGNDIYNVDNLNVSGLSTFAGGITVPALATISHANVVNTVSSSNIYVSDALNVSGLASLSGLFVRNVATISDLFTTNPKIHIGPSAGFSNQQNDAIAIGLNAGSFGQNSGIAIGTGAGQQNQGGGIAIGTAAGNSNQSTSIAIGPQSGQTNQGTSSIAIGAAAGQFSQTSNAIAIGLNAGLSAQSEFAIAIGHQTAISGQGSNSIAMGYRAGYINQISNSIILNATGSELNAQTISGFYVAPVSESSNISGLEILTYNPTTFQIQQNSNITISGGSVGIGTSNLTQKFEVAGSVGIQSAPAPNISGYLRMLAFQGSNFIQSGLSSGTASSAPLVFTNVNNTVQWMTLSGGRLGIGTVTPNYTLDVCNTIGTCNVRFTTFAGGNFGFEVRGPDNGSNGTDLTFNGRATSLGAFSEYMRIKTSGLIGINCNAPGYTLDVNGTVNCSTIRYANPTAGPAFTNIAASGYTTDTNGTKGGGYNFASVTSNSAGDYTINFTSDIGTTEYIGLFTPITNRSYCVINTRTSSNVRIFTYDGAGQFSIIFNFVIYK